MRITHIVLAIAISLFSSCSCSVRAQTTHSGGTQSSGTIGRVVSDVTQPVITPDPPAESNLTSSSASIAITTNEVAICRYRYGTSTGSYGTTGNYEVSYVTSRTLQITGLNASTAYFYVVDCQDPSGNTRTSGEDSFTTSASGGSALLPSYGIEVDGVNNSTPGKERNVIVPGHYSDTQFKPAAFSVSDCTRASNVVTCTLTSDPTATTPRLYTGFPVVVAGMSDTGFNGTFTLSNVTSTAVVWNQTGSDGSTNGGTVRSTLVPRPAQGSSFTDPQFNGTPVERLLDHANGPSTCPSNGVTHNYVNRGIFSKDLTHVKLTCRSGNNFFLNISSRVVSCNGTVPGGTGVWGWVWSRTDNDVAYYIAFNTNILKKIVVSTCATSTVMTFTGYTSAYIGGEGNNQDGESVLNQAGTKTLIPVILINGTTRYVTVATAEDGTNSTIYDTASSNTIDSFRVWPSGKSAINWITPGSGTGQGMDLINADGTYGRKITTQSAHSGIGVSAEGDEVVLMQTNSSGLPGPCSGKLQGAIMVKASDSTMTCIWNKTNNDNAGTGNDNSTSTYFHTSDMRSPWAVVDQDNNGVLRAESAISSTWDSGWGRGRGELVLCKLTTGTSSCYRLAFVRGVMGNSDGSEFYNGHSWCTPSTIEDGVNSASVPKYVICSSDMRTSASGGSVQHEPWLFKIR